MSWTYFCVRFIVTFLFFLLCNISGGLARSKSCLKGRWVCASVVAAALRSSLPSEVFLAISWRSGPELSSLPGRFAVEKVAQEKLDPGNQVPRQCFVYQKMTKHDRNFQVTMNQFQGTFIFLRPGFVKQIADSAQTEYCTTFHCSCVRVFVCHRRDISHFSHI